MIGVSIIYNEEGEMGEDKALSIVSRFKNMPETEEKNEIMRKYIEDEIGSFEFFQLASRYLQDAHDALMNDEI